MKSSLAILIILFLLQLSFNTYSQEIPVTTEQQLENLADADQSETEDDSYLLELEHFKKDPINLNKADADELKQLRVISALQINNLITYRNLLGKLFSIYELQAVPSWDIATIKKVLPFVAIEEDLSLKEEFGKRFRNGEHSLLIRLTQILEKSAGFNRSTTGTKYLGSPQRILFRYRYTYKNLLQFGITGDKDAGEQFLKGSQKLGFDFYSAHLFARKIGLIQSLAIGDFSVSMGQGLIQWQGLAFKKSADILGIKRQSAVLRPYTSAGEFYFHRGIGVTIKKGKIESTLFASLRKLSANFVADTVKNEDYISSFLSSGYHRTSSEIADRNNLSQTTFGGNIVYRNHQWQVGVNGGYYNFSLPIQKRQEPYNLYAISGKNWYNISIDYSYTHKNLHLFGEAAADKNLNKAFINGLLISVDSRIDLSFVQRTISQAFQSINGNAFTENTYPVNETGFYVGASIRLVNGWRIDMYADIYKFPWLKYLVDAPSSGKDFLAQLTYTPTKQLEIYSRIRTESKQANQSDNNSITNFLVPVVKQSWRNQLNYKVNSNFTLRNRIEMIWYNKRNANSETGFLGFVDIIYKPLLKKYGGVLRIQYFETDDYNSRIYAYENDVLYGYSIPAFFGKGFRYYGTLNYDINKQLSCWLRLAQLSYSGENAIGSGLDQISSNKKTEVKLQLRLLF